MLKDAMGQAVAVGSTVMLAKTGKSAGISWRRNVVTRVSAYRFWVEETCSWKGKEGQTYESGPHCPENCIVVDKLLTDG